MLAIFNQRLGDHIRRLFPDCTVLSGTAMAAPSFVAAALGEPAPQPRPGAAAHPPGRAGLRHRHARAFNWSPDRGYLLTAGDRLIVLATRRGLRRFLSVH